MCCCVDCINFSPFFDWRLFRNSLYICVQAKKLCKPPCAYKTTLIPFFFLSRQVMQSVLIKNLHSNPFIFLLKKFKGVKISICQSQDGAMHLTHHLCCTVQCFNCTVSLTFQWNKWIIERGQGDRKQDKGIRDRQTVCYSQSLGGIVIIYIAILPLWLILQEIVFGAYSLARLIALTSSISSSLWRLGLV